MKARITMEELRALSEGQRTALKNIWEPSNGDRMTDGEQTYLFYHHRALPQEEGNETSYDPDTFFPLLSVSQIHDLLTEHFLRTDLNFLLPEVVYELIYAEDQTVIMEECLDGLWGLLIANLTYQSLVYKLAALLVDTFSAYVQGEEVDPALADGVFVEQELRHKNPASYQRILDELEEISPYIICDAEVLFDDSWYVFDEKVAG